MALEGERAVVITRAVDALPRIAFHAELAANFP